MKRSSFNANRYSLFLLLMVLGLVLAACSAAEPDVFTVGVLNPFGGDSSADDPSVGGPVAGFKDGLAQAGFVEGDNVNYIQADMSSGDFSPEAMDKAAQELLAAEVNLIYCISTTACQSAQTAAADSGTPVVFVAVTDPIAAGLVEDWVRPGGHVTGIASAAKDSGNEGLRLEWLVKMSPNIHRVYVPHNPDEPATAAKLVAVKDAAAKLDIELVLVEIRTPEEATAAFTEAPEDIDAMLLFSERVYFGGAADTALALALERNIPLSTQGEEVGVLMFYSSDLEAMSAQAARLAGQILNGTDPATLPVEAPEFFLTINLQTAEAIGLEVPESVIQAADTILR
ncbi:MAG: ABC transporter substrate-binding protein [Chloroflexi bacterium]|nr:ABC transporter substrate-binding protein [Chloroflexota bacterium]MBP8054375.1 ABC transporter substrate-binding protein [Chloroflexota bacterium]